MRSGPLVMILAGVLTTGLAGPPAANLAAADGPGGPPVPHFKVDPGPAAATAAPPPAEPRTARAGRRPAATVTDGLSLDPGSDPPAILEWSLDEDGGVTVVTGTRPTRIGPGLARAGRFGRTVPERPPEPEIGLSIAIARGVSIVPAYGLGWSGIDPDADEDLDLSHRFSIGARFGF